MFNDYSPHVEDYSCFEEVILRKSFSLFQTIFIIVQQTSVVCGWDENEINVFKVYLEKICRKTFNFRIMKGAERLI